MTDEQQRDGSEIKPSKMKPGAYVAVGIGVGVALGVAMGNIAVGVAVGVAIGAGLATNEHRKRTAEDEGTPGDK